MRGATGSEKQEQKKKENREQREVGEGRGEGTGAEAGPGRVTGVEALAEVRSVARKEAWQGTEVRVGGGV